MCYVRQRRVLFGAIPLNLVSSHFTHIENKSDFQAFFKVLYQKKNVCCYTKINVPYHLLNLYGHLSNFRNGVASRAPQNLHNLNTEACLNR